MKAEATSNVYNCTRKLTGSVPEVDQEIGSVKLHAPDPWYAANPETGMTKLPSPEEVSLTTYE